MEKIDAAFAHTFGFDLDVFKTWFSLFSSGSPVIKGELENGKAKNVVISFESMPFDTISPDLAFAYSKRLSFVAQLAKTMEGLPVEMPNLEE